MVNGKEPKSIKVLPIAGGEARVIYRVAKQVPQGVPNFSGLEWSADGQELLFIRTAAAEANPDTPGIARDSVCSGAGGRERLEGRGYLFTGLSRGRRRMVYTMRIRNAKTESSLR